MLHFARLCASIHPSAIGMADGSATVLAAVRRRLVSGLVPLADPTGAVLTPAGALASVLVPLGGLVVVSAFLICDPNELPLPWVILLRFGPLTT